MPPAARLGDTMPQKADETGAAWATRLRRRAFEDARYVLPLATTTSLGLTTNAREMELVISRCLSHRSAEVRALGEAMRQASNRVAVNFIPSRLTLDFGGAQATASYTNHGPVGHFGLFFMGAGDELLLSTAGAAVWTGLMLLRLQV